MHLTQSPPLQSMRGSSSAAETMNCYNYNAELQGPLNCSATYSVGGASVTVKTRIEFDSNNEGIGTSTSGSFGGYEITIGGHCTHNPAYVVAGGGTSTTCVW